MSGGRPLTVLVVGRDDERAAPEDAIKAGLDDQVTVIGVDEPTGAADAVPDDADVPATVLLPGDGDADDMVATLRRTDPRFANAVIVLSARPRHDDLHRSLDADLVHAIAGLPWAPGSLSLEVGSLVARWLEDRDADDPRLADLRIDRRPFHLPRSDLLGDLELNEHEVTSRLVEALDRALGRRPRLHLPPGTRLSRQDARVDRVVVVLRGAVALDRSTEVGELRLHHATTGPVVGLLALAQQSRAFFTARTTSDVEALHVSLPQLDLALRNEPEVGALLAAVAIRALAQRLKRSEELQVESVQLNRELEDERSRLQAALSQLEAARLELVESARFATLGELAAGVAHELNNPLAALTRAAGHLVDDLRRVLEGHPGSRVLLDGIERARTSAPTSTAQDRAARSELAEQLGDRELARRLVAVGVTDVARARELAAATSEELALIETGWRIGSSARNLDVASSRISELVTSLRSYARPSQEPIDGVDLHTTLEDTLRLVAHRLGDVEVERDYGQLPPIRANPGELGQVWTNLLVNAAEALEGEGRLRVITDAPSDDTVRVRIADDGPGVPPELTERMFEPRFTTKHGTVRYGLGLGLAIAKRLVEGHGGTISLRSRPGDTVITVQLPVSGPPRDDPHEETPR